jgi:hypothetical protein
VKGLYRFIEKVPEGGPKTHRCTVCGKVGNDRGNLRNRMAILSLIFKYYVQCPDLDRFGMVRRGLGSGSRCINCTEVLKKIFTHFSDIFSPEKKIIGKDALKNYY